MKKIDKKLFTAITTLSGTVIGAGFLGIPYAVSNSGFLIGLIHMVILCSVMLMLNLIMGEIVLSTNSIHHIAGYSSKYLGNKTKWFVFFASIIGFYAALVAYLIGQGVSLSFIFTGGSENSLWFGLGFWFLMSILTFGGIKEFKKIEPIAVISVLIVTLLLGILNFDKINLANLSYTNYAYLFAPFGVVLFAFLGMSSVPEIKRVLGKNTGLMKKAIIIGSLIPLIVYVLFTIIVLGIYGSGVEQVATINFGKIVTLLGIFTMFSAFLALSLCLQDTYRFDLYLHKKLAWALSIFVPLILFVPISIFNLAGFSKVLSFGGAISGGLLSIALLLIHEHLTDQKFSKRHRKPEFIVYLPLMIKIIFIILFVTGIIYEFL